MYFTPHDSFDAPDAIPRADSPVLGQTLKPVALLPQRARSGSLSSHFHLPTGYTQIPPASARSQSRLASVSSTSSTVPTLTSESSAYDGNASLHSEHIRERLDELLLAASIPANLAKGEEQNVVVYQSAHLAAIAPPNTPMTPYHQSPFASASQVHVDTRPIPHRSSTFPSLLLSAAPPRPAPAPPLDLSFPLTHAPSHSHSSSSSGSLLFPAFTPETSPSPGTITFPVVAGTYDDQFAVSRWSLTSSVDPIQENDYEVKDTKSRPASPQHRDKATPKRRFLSLITRLSTKPSPSRAKFEGAPLRTAPPTWEGAPSLPTPPLSAAPRSAPLVGSMPTGSMPFLPGSFSTHSSEHLYGLQAPQALSISNSSIPLTPGSVDSSDAEWEREEDDDDEDEDDEQRSSWGSATQQILAFPDVPRDTPTSPAWPDVASMETHQAHPPSSAPAQQQQHTRFPSADSSAHGIITNRVGLRSMSSLPSLRTNAPHLQAHGAHKPSGLRTLVARMGLGPPSPLPSPPPSGNVSSSSINAEDDDSAPEPALSQTSAASEAMPSLPSPGLSPLSFGLSAASAGIFPIDPSPLPASLSTAVFLPEPQAIDLPPPPPLASPRTRTDSNALLSPLINLDAFKHTFTPRVKRTRSAFALTITPKAEIRTKTNLMGKKKRKLMISGIADAAGYDAVRAWCEGFGEVKRMAWRAKGVETGVLLVDFKDRSVAETVCRLQAKVNIKGAGSVDISWYTDEGKKHSL